MNRLILIALAFLGLCSCACAQMPMLGFGAGNNGSGPPAYTGVGDLGLSSVVSFWGLRCYSNSYGGNVADVWDSLTGSTTETLITCSAGGTLNQTVNSLSVTCANGCAVKELYDQVGTNNFIQSTNANRPTMLTSGCGYTKPWCMTFLLANSQYMVATAGALTQTFDVATVAERTANFSTVGYILSFSATAYFEYRNATNNTSYNFGTGANVATTDSAWHSLKVEAAGASSNVTIDTTNSAVSIGTNGTSTTWRLGASSTPNAYMSGSFAEAFVTSAANFSNFAAINTNQHTYWGF